MQSKPERPWQAGDPSKKVSLNVPFPEPLHMQLDYLLENRLIRSKSAFIRDAVTRAADNRIGPQCLGGINHAALVCYQKPTTGTH